MASARLRQDKGYVGEFDVPNLREDLVAALKDVKAGGVTEPIQHQRGLSDPSRRCAHSRRNDADFQRQSCS